MAPWVKKTFVEVLPKYLFIERPKKESEPGPFDPLPSPSKQLSQHEKGGHEMEDRDVEEEVIENCSQHSSSLHKQPCPVTIAASVNSMQIYGDATLLAHNHFRNNMNTNQMIHQLDGLATLSPLEYSHRYHQHGHIKGFNQGGGPPPLPPHQHHHHPSHAQAHTHPPLHDENGFITNDPNDESATSDLATSYLAYRYELGMRSGCARDALGMHSE